MLFYPAGKGKLKIYAEFQTILILPLKCKLAEKFRAVVIFCSMQENEKTYAIFPSAHSKKVIENLKKQNHKILLLPAVKFAKIDLSESSSGALKNFKEFDWIIFTDVLAAEFFLEFASENELDLFDLDEIRVCTNGEAAAERLRFVQIHTDVIPPRNSADVIFQTISDYVADEQALSEAKFLVLKKKDEITELTEKFGERKIFFREISLYNSEVSINEGFARLKALIIGGAIDELVFASPEDLERLKSLFSYNEIKDLLIELKIVALSEIALLTLKENGISNYSKLERT